MVLRRPCHVFWRICVKQRVANVGGFIGIVVQTFASLSSLEFLICERAGCPRVSGALGGEGVNITRCGPIGYKCNMR